MNKKPYVKKAVNNDWCARCGGGGEWLEHPDGVVSRPLEHVVCPVCEGTGVVPLSSPHAWSARTLSRHANLPAV